MARGGDWVAHPPLSGSVLSLGSRNQGCRFPQVGVRAPVGQLPIINQALCLLLSQGARQLERGNHRTIKRCSHKGKEEQVTSQACRWGLAGRLRAFAAGSPGRFLHTLETGVETFESAQDPCDTQAPPPFATIF